jgi:hypothetical protein
MSRYKLRTPWPWMKNLNFTNSCTINMNWNIYTYDTFFEKSVKTINSNNSTKFEVNWRIMRSWRSCLFFYTFTIVVIKSPKQSLGDLLFLLRFLLLLLLFLFFLWNFKFPIGFYSNPHPLWTPKNITLTPFTTNLKTLGSTRNIYL